MNELEFYNQQFKKYKKYDHDRSYVSAPSFDSAEGYFAHLVNLYSNPKNTLVDLGCGDGYFTSKLAKFNATVIGIEPSSLISAANELLEETKLSNLSFLQEDAYQLPFDDNSINLVISRRGPDPENEVFRVLKQEGHFIFITIGEKDALSLKEIVGRGQHFESSIKVSDELKIKYRKAGFIKIECKEYLYHEYYSSKDALKEFLHRVPIFENFSKLDHSSIDTYCEKFTNSRIKLERHRVVLLAKKSS